MKIKKVTIQNYKSIKDLEFELSDGLNAFIGMNSAGKSNIFDAINWLLGPTYPTFNSISKEDHFLGDKSNVIKIKLEFSDGNTLELNENKLLNKYSKQEFKSGLFYTNDTYCNAKKREKYCSAYLGVDRKIFDHLPSNKWSLMGRLLLEVNKKFSKKDEFKKQLEEIRDKSLFTVTDESGENIMKKLVKILQKETSEQLNIPESNLKIDLTLYDPWNFYKTLQLIMKESDMDMEFQASSLGMGVQASISIAILKAYSELHLKNKSPIFIDEPELFLHPQAQINFYKTLRQLSKEKAKNEGTQIIYTTHSPNFLSVGNFDEIFIVRKDKEKGTIIKKAQPDNFIIDLKNRCNNESTKEGLLLHYKNAYEQTGDTQKANEGFFAKKIILVEGSSESLILPYFFELANFDFIKESISIVRCGSKNELDRFFRLYSEFGIPCYIIFDGDKATNGKNKSIMSLFEDNPNDYPDNQPTKYYLGFTENFNQNLGLETSKKGRDLFIDVKSKIKTKDQLPNWVDELISKIKELPDESNSFLKLS